MNIKEQQSSENIKKIIEYMDLSKKNAQDKKSIFLDATILNGHINLGYFESLEDISIENPFHQRDTVIKTGITSIDLSNNLDFTNLYCSANTLPNFQTIILSHPNQIPYTSIYGVDNPLSSAIERAKKVAFFRNINVALLNTDDEEMIAALICLRDNYQRKLDLNNQMLELKKQLNNLENIIGKNGDTHKIIESEISNLMGLPKIPDDISFKEFPRQFINSDLNLSPLDKIRKNNEIRLEQLRRGRANSL